MRESISIQGGVAKFLACGSVPRFREGRRFEVRFDLDAEEQRYGRVIADEIESTYGYEPMPPEVGRALVADVEIEGARYHYVGKGTINDYLFTINW